MVLTLVYIQTRLTMQINCLNQMQCHYQVHLTMFNVNCWTAVKRGLKTEEAMQLFGSHSKLPNLGMSTMLTGNCFNALNCFSTYNKKTTRTWILACVSIRSRYPVLLTPTHDYWIHHQTGIATRASRPSRYESHHPSRTSISFTKDWWYTHETVNPLLKW